MWATPHKLLTDTVEVAVVGAGGTGSQIIRGLAKLHAAMTSLGHPGGLDVTVYDDDLVSPANIGRQEFFPSDVGMPKSIVLVHRINMTMGTRWDAQPRRFSAAEFRHQEFKPMIVIGCVDNRASRAEILEACLKRSHALWLDIGNRAEDGQAVLGEIGMPKKKGELSLPTAADLFPEIVDPSLDDKDDAPSCSLAEALEKQALFTNQGVATWSLNLLWQMFRYGKIEHHGVFINLQTGRASPLPVDPEAWGRMGYNPKRNLAKAA